MADTTITVTLRRTEITAGPKATQIVVGQPRVTSVATSRGPRGPQGDVGPVGPAGAAAPAFGSYVISGGGVVWISGFSYTVEAAQYVIDGHDYASPQSDVTLQAADPSLDRIDVIAVNDAGDVVVLAGTPGSGIAPDVDPTTQLQLTQINVPAGSTSDPVVSTTPLYLNHSGEWVYADNTANLNPDSTVDPYEGTKAIEGTNVVAGNQFTLTNGSSIDLADFNSLVFFIKPKAAWDATVQLVIRWIDTASGEQKGSAVPLKNGTRGFDSGSSTYQVVIVPTSYFAANGIPVDRLRMRCTGSGGPIGFFLDYVILQSGVAPPPSASFMYFKGDWSGSAAYEAQQVVRRAGRAYVSVQPNVASEPLADDSNPDWKVLVSVAGDTGPQGPKGDTGAGGAKGATGDTGPAGVKGDTGPQGAVGDTGAAGAQGAKGDTGAAGAKGDTGAQGDTGPAGPKGDTGAAGAKGDTGAVGATGDTGAAGAKGDTGAAGAKGDTGAQGDTGAAGAKGDTGAAGAKGDTGAAGAKGDTGAAGAKGDTGAAGAKGDTGAAGAKGDTGAAGAKGDTGATGAKGDTGPSGVTTESIIIACSDLTVPITVGTGKACFRMPYAFTVTAVRASLKTAQSSGSIFTVDINESGTSIISTKLTIDNTEKTSTTAATPAVISDSSLADDAEITVDVDQVGAAADAVGLVVTLIGHQ